MKNQLRFVPLCEKVPPTICFDELPVNTMFIDAHGDVCVKMYSFNEHNAVRLTATNGGYDVCSYEFVDEHCPIRVIYAELREIPKPC